MTSLRLVRKNARQNNLGAKAPSGRMAERFKALGKSLEFISHAGSNPAPSTNAVMRLVYNLGLEYKPEEFFGASPMLPGLQGIAHDCLSPLPRSREWVFLRQILTHNI